jgi:transketolase
MRIACLDKVHDLAKRDSRVVFIGSDLSPGLLGDMKREMPDRYYMEGITEQNVVGMAAGFALEGYVPYVNTIATFITRRCYEQVAVDLCLHDLPVRLIGNGGGLVYAPLGPTHLAIEDMAIMRALPNMAVVAVCDAEEMKSLMDATLDWPHPIYIRLAKGGDPVVSRKQNGFAIGKAIPMRKAETRRPVALMSTGVMTTNCLAAADILARAGIDTSVLHIHTVKPLDEESVLEHAAKAALVVTVEEGVAIGGLGSAITDVLVETLGQQIPRIRRIALPDSFPHKYGLQTDLFEVAGLAPEQIAVTVSTAMSKQDAAVA